MVTVLFWNVGKKPLLARLARLATREAADVVILAECADAPADVTAALNAAGAGWAFLPSLCDRLRGFSRLGPGAMRQVFTDDSGRMNVWELGAGPDPPLLLAAVHLVSKFGWSAVDQLDAARPIAEDLELLESRRPNRGTVAIGDFNLSPYDPGLVSAAAFHATMTRDLAERRSHRVVQGRRQRKTFYNPMWQFMTDRSPRPSGTYYRDDAVPSNHYWYTLDHVLVRPELAGKVKRVAILDHDGVDSLTAPGDGRPDAELASDHLPILVTLDV